MCDLTNPIFTDADKAREHLENLYWPHGPICRHCGNADASRITKLAGKSTRPGVRWCNECDKPFSVTVGTVMEDSKIPLNKWVLAFHLMAASKKGMSAHQLHRMLGVTYKTAWFLCHRIREAMGDVSRTRLAARLAARARSSRLTKPMSAAKPRTARYREPAPKKAVVSLVERDGRARSFHVAERDRENPWPNHPNEREPQKHAQYRRSRAIRQNGPRVRRASCGRSFAQRIRLQARRAHRHDQQRRELLFSILKRGIIGTYHSSQRSSSCTAILQSSISATTTVLSLASKTQSAPPKR